MSRVRLAPPLQDANLSFATQQYLRALFERINEGPLLIQGYDKAALPAAIDWGDTTAGQSFSSIIFVSDDVGGAVLAFSDGTSWRRVTDRAVIS